MNNKIVIGREDMADFPELNLEAVRVKIDTGAYTSSFHCRHIQEVKNEGEKKLQCYFLDPGHQQYHDKEYIFPDFTVKKVKSSNGISEERYSVKTTIRLFNRVYPIRLTLTERGNMRFPVLLGRKFLSKRFLVDSSKKDLSSKGEIQFPPPS